VGFSPRGHLKKFSKGIAHKIKDSLKGLGCHRKWGNPVRKSHTLVLNFFRPVSMEVLKHTLGKQEVLKIFHPFFSKASFINAIGASCPVQREKERAPWRMSMFKPPK
jgi:hypothetical protein